MANHCVLAFDPGGTTGWAMYQADVMQEPEGDVGWYAQKWNCGQLGPGDHHEELANLIELSITQDFHLVTESFEFRQGTVRRTGLDLSSKEYIGVMKLLCQQRPEIGPLHQQTAALGKGFVTDKKIKAMDLWYPGQKHAMDATRHLVYYLVNKLHRVDLVESWRALA